MTDSVSVDFQDSDVIEIISAEEYDSKRAKLQASVSWILTKAYGNNIPDQLKDPFYENSAGHLQVKPQLMNLMTSSELYCQACANMFPDTAFQWQGHWSIIQILSRKGIYIAETGEAVVTETVLMHTAPFKVAAHLSLIDALMKAYTSEIASVEHIVQAVRRFASFSASSELPGTIEEALLFWINKACTALAQRGDLDIIQGETSQKVRIISKTTPREQKSVPKMEDLMNDIGDGSALASTIAFYQPDALNIADVCLKESVGIADSLYNLRLIRAFCERSLVMKCFHFTFEDLLYGRENLHDNVIVFVAEIFFLLEAADRGDGRMGTISENASLMVGRRQVSSNMPQVSISNATKRSFQKLPDETRHFPDKATSGPNVLTSRQPLLQKRANSRQGSSHDISLDLPQRTNRRSHSLSSPQERETIRQSVLAWQDDQDIQNRSSKGSNLLENVSMDWDADTMQNLDTDTVSSIDIAEFEATGHRQLTLPNLSDPNHPEYMEVVSVASTQVPGISARSHAAGMTPDWHEPLLPAKLRPAKEKGLNHSKAEERGDHLPRKKTVSPTKLVRGKLSPPSNGIQGRTSPFNGGLNEGSSRNSSESSADETIVTPLASIDLVTPRSSEILTSDSDASSPPQQSQPTLRTGYEAFMIPPDSSAEIPLRAPKRTGSGMSSEQPTTSYTLDSSIHDSQTAREAGLPVIEQSTSETIQNGEVAVSRVSASREGSVASSRSSGDFSDHESMKIHQDHKTRESLKHSPHRLSNSYEKPWISGSSPQTFPIDTLSTPPKNGELITDHLKAVGTVEMQKKPGTTSFAEIRRMKMLGNVDNSGFVYMQHGQDAGGDPNGQQNRVTLKSSFLQKQDSGKKTTFAQLPTETTWQQSAQRSMSTSASGSESNGSEEGGTDRPPTSELSQLRMKLEEKRREIERKKQRQEVQTAKIRQRLGKAAFMRVISKHNEGTSASQTTSSIHPGISSLRGVSLTGTSGFTGGDVADSAPSSKISQALLQERLCQVIPEESPRPSTLQPGLTSTTSLAGATATVDLQTGQDTRPFSRAGIQQTIDGVRRRWFHSSDPDGEMIQGRRQSEEEGFIRPDSLVDGDMVQSSPPCIAASLFGQPSKQTTFPVPTAESESLCIPEGATSHAAHIQEMSHSPRVTPERCDFDGSVEQEPYDSSLDRLNRSLSELQGEIKRLTLQQEQFRSVQSPQGPVPAQPTFQSQQQQQHHFPHLQHPSQQTVPPNVLHGAAHQQLPYPQSVLTSTPLPKSVDPTLHAAPLSGLVANVFSPTQLMGMPPEDEESDSGNGFFVSFGEETTPKRPKPKLGKDRDVGKKEWGDGSQVDLNQSLSPPQQQVYSAPVASELSSNHSSSHHSLLSGSDDGSTGQALIICPDGTSLEMSKETDLILRKKERLMQQQLRRKEQQEKKRIEKETETARRQEIKMLKDEEQERKKAEEKARRQAIFQQYMQRKQENEEEKSPVASVPRRENHNRGYSRPKSMFAKARPLPSDLDDGLGRTISTGTSHSSQEDLSSYASPPGSIATHSPFRLYPNSRGKMRKAVSCNTLTQNGSQGASTYRRPPSPDIQRLKHGALHSNESSSETSSHSGSQPGSNPSEYSGPKLFVKPSSKSNRHIIINAISHCCLAGSVNIDMKNKVLEEIARSAAKHFLILFRDHGCQFRGLYSFDPEGEEAYKILGVGPRQMNSTMVERFYKYNSGGKSFTEVTSTKHLSVSIDAVVLMNIYWKTKPTATARR